MDPATTVFDPPASTWQRLSPKLVTVKRLTSAITLAVPTVVAAVALWLGLGLWWPPAIVVGVALLLYLWLFLRARRWVAAWGWTERDGDLCLRSGLMWRRLLVVPFARLQLVKVSAGPLQRAFGLSTVELVTASMATDATIPGLPAADAVALRDRLIEASDALGSGL